MAFGHVPAEDKPRRQPAKLSFDEIDYIQLSVLSAEEWRRLSVCTVTKTSPYSATKSKEGTLFDERMGSITSGMKCQTCHSPETQCPGHFGLIELPVPVYNKLFVKQIEKLLRCLCLECSRLRLQPNQLASYQLPESCQERLRAIEDWCRSIEQCSWPDCQSVLPSKIRYDSADKHQFFKYYTSTDTEVPISSDEMLHVFKRMDNETLEFLKFNTFLHSHPNLYVNGIHRHLFRPENLIFTVIPVIPPCARPYVVRDGQIYDDDLVDLYRLILKDCDKIRNTLPTSPDRQTAITSLHFNVWSIVSQELQGKDKKGKRVQHNLEKKYIKDRLKDKDGRVQGNIVGKRANFTARGVIISGGLMLKDNELGVPQYVADTQTVSEPVLSWNMTSLQNMVKQGRVIRVTRGNTTKRLDAMVGGGVHFNLKEGDIVERKLKDGDDILFNRQPSIRLECFLNFKVKIVPGYAFRLGLTYTSAYGADYDGDEMNSHTLQEPLAIEEARVLFNAGYNLVSTQSGTPCNGLVQDTLNGLYLLTNKLKIPVETFYWIATCIEMPMSRIEDLLQRASRYYPKYVQADTIPRTKKHFKKSHIPGNLLVSLLFPLTPKLKFKMKQDPVIDPKRPFVWIRHGVLLPQSAPLTKKLVGPGGALLHWIWHYYSSDDAMKFASLCERMVYYWLANYGLSLGPSDCFLADTHDAKVALRTLQEKYDSIVSQSIPSSEKEASLDALFSSLNNAVLTPIVRKKIQKQEENSFTICERSGAKGALINLIQTSVCVGQQSINGGRIPFAYSRNRRTLPCYQYGDDSLVASGFITHNYIEGLSPQEAFFHAMVGRKGLISTGIKTSDTGYIQKCMSRKMEDLVVQLDGTVRDANNCIIDFFYGGDGMDPRRLVKTSFGRMPVDLIRVAETLQDECIRWSDKTCSLRVKCGCHGESKPLTEEEIETSLSLILPCHPGVKTPSAELATKQLHAKIRKVLSDLPLCEVQKAKYVIIIKQMIDAAMIAYGTNVGLIASSSMASPVVQLTLSTFRLPGIKTRDTTNGVIRLKELLNTTKTKDQKKPSVLVYPSRDIQDRIVSTMVQAKNSKNPHDRISARLYAMHELQSLRFSLQHTLLKDLVSSWTLYRTDESVQGSFTGLVTYDYYEKPWWVNVRTSTFDVDVSFRKTWVVVLKLNPYKMFQRFTIQQIMNIIEKHGDGMVTFIPSPECFYEIHCVLNRKMVDSFESHITQDTTRLKMKPYLGYHFAKYVLIPYLKNLKIAGLPGVKQVIPIEDPKTNEWYLDVSCESKTLPQSIQRYQHLLGNCNVDASQTIADDIHTLLNVLGIEAMEEYGIQETSRVLNDNADRRHIELLWRAMTFSGTPTAASRHGMHQPHQPLSRILFETHVEQATVAAFQNEYDVCTGMVSSVMLGKQAPRIGTGAVKVISTH